METVKLFPDYLSAAFELASLYASQQRFDDALNVLGSDTAETHNQRGILYLKMKQFDRAEEELRRAVETQPKPEYWNNLGLVLQRLDQPEAAEAAYMEALSAHPDYAECEVNLSFLLVQEQKWEPALTHLVHLTEANPKMWNARLARAYALENLQRKDEALIEYTRLLADAPADWPQRPQVEDRIRKLKN